MTKTERHRLWRIDVDSLSGPQQPFAPNGHKGTAKDGTGSSILPVRHPGRYWQNRHLVTDGLKHPVRVPKVARRARQVVEWESNRLRAAC